MRKEQFLAVVDEFRSRHNMSDAAFGRWARNSTSFLYRLRSGGDVRLETVNSVIAKIQEYGKDSRHLDERKHRNPEIDVGGASNKGHRRKNTGSNKKRGNRKSPSSGSTQTE